MAPDTAPTMLFGLRVLSDDQPRSVTATARRLPNVLADLLTDNGGLVVVEVTRLTV